MQSASSWSKSPSFAATPAVPTASYCSHQPTAEATRRVASVPRSGVAISDEEHSHAPVRFIQNHNLVAACWKGHLAPRKVLDVISHHINTSAKHQCPNRYRGLSVAHGIPHNNNRHHTHRSSDAFSSSTASLYADPSSVRARQCTLVVFPVPGGPCEQQHTTKPFHEMGLPAIPIAPGNTARHAPQESDYSCFLGLQWSAAVQSPARYLSHPPAATPSRAFESHPTFHEAQVILHASTSNH